MTEAVLFYYSLIFFQMHMVSITFLLVLFVATRHAEAFGLTWADLRAKVPSLSHEGPAVFDTTIGEIPEETDLEGKLAIYVDRNHWCPNSQRALLALEIKEVDYAKILVDEDYTNPNTLPKLQWPDGTVQMGKDIYEILEKIQIEYQNGPDLYKQDMSVSVDIVRASIERRFYGIMPRYTEPSAVAPFIFRNEEIREREGEVVPKFKFQVSLEEIDEVLEEYEDGSYFAGRDITAADIFWVPYIERFAAQLPLLYDRLEPRSLEYEAIQEWFDALDQEIPCYACKVKGRAETWQSVLAKFHPELELRSGVTVPNLPQKRNFDANKVWSIYAEGKVYLASTPSLEVAAQIIRKREDLASAAFAACKSITDHDAADAALRELCNVLTTINGFDTEGSSQAAAKLSGDARDVVSFLVNEGLSVPRDIGAIPMEALCGLAVSAPAPRIK
jgi:glutathione S-transferase